MNPFDFHDPERRPPSALTPRCPYCAEAAMPGYDGNCFRHAIPVVGESFIWASPRHISPLARSG